MLLLSTALTALGSWILAFAPSFTTFLIGFAVQGAYVVWLPLEISIIPRRTAHTGRQGLLTRRAAAILVGALELSVIVAALTSGILVEKLGMSTLLALPAIVVTLCLVLIWVGVEDVPGIGTGEGHERGEPEDDDDPRPRAAGTHDAEHDESTHDESECERDEPEAAPGAGPRARRRSAGPPRTS